MDVDAVGGIATRQQLLALGHTGWQLTAAVRLGAVQRIRRGWYRSAIATPAAVEAVRVGGQLSHTSAATSYGLWSGLDRRLHVTVAQGASRLRRPSTFASSKVVIHWVHPGRQPLTDLVTWRVGLEECLRGVVRTSSAETAIACLDTAITEYGFTLAEIQSMFQDEPAESRRRAASAQEGADSGTESVARQRFGKLGYAVEQQVNLIGVGWVDLVLNGRLVVEIDGFTYHSTPDDVDRDYRRDAALTARAIPHLRFTYAQVMYDWAFVESAVHACLS